MTIDNPQGNYRFIAAGAPFSAGCAAAAGFEIVHAALAPFAPLQSGFALIESHLRQSGRPMAALCGMHLRLPGALSAQGFADFNQPYIERLRSWKLEVSGANPVARTNVALAVNPVTEPVLAGFFYTVRADSNHLSLVLSGAAESRSKPSGGREIVAQGDTSARGLALETQCILDELSGRLMELGAGWNDITAVNLYTIHDIHPVMAATLLPALGRAAHSGINWHYARPPVADLEMEIDARAVYREIVID